MNKPQSNIDKLKSYKHILCVVESPNKVQTLSKIFKSLGLNNVFVKASVGHISSIHDGGEYNMGIDPKTFEMNLRINDDKRKVVKELKDQADISDFILIASDPDREGSAIAWSLKHFLRIPDSKYQRILYHEITKSAIEKALNNPEKIDDNMVSAAYTRTRLDKIVGYRLSPIAIRDLNARSVGRCQSAGLKLVVDREKEINNFKPETFYEMYLNFKKDNIDFKAKYQGDKSGRFNSKPTSITDCDTIARECKGNAYIIDKVEGKMTLQNAPLPFITSSFQQECSSKLGLSVKTAISAAQRLFEGINIKGDHIAFITYIRTDSPHISDEFVPLIKDYIVKNYGEQYYQGVRTVKKKDNAQEGHECLRVVDLNITPNDLASYINDDILIKVYRLIYNRTIASLMTARQIFETTYTISNNNEHFFSMTSKEERFDGWKRVYNVDKEKDEVIKGGFKEKEVLKDTTLERVEKQTQPPARYTEASLIKTLDKLGIGRPSTYAAIISTLLDEKRNYCKLEDKKLKATDLAIKLVDFLDKWFPEIVSSNYTANLEKSLDEISEGKLKDIDFLTTFYDKLNGDINKEEGDNKITRKCPNCGATLAVRKGRYGPFLACPNYPNCKYTEKITK